MCLQNLSCIFKDFDYCLKAVYQKRLEVRKKHKVFAELYLFFRILSKIGVLNEQPVTNNQIIQKSRKDFHDHTKYFQLKRF